MKGGYKMYRVIDTKGKVQTEPNEMYCNAVRKCQKLNIQYCGIEEIDKPESERRFIIK